MVWQLLEQWEFELLELLVVVVLQVAVHRQVVAHPFLAFHPFHLVAFRHLWKVRAFLQNS